MKKIYLLLMLLMGYVGESGAQNAYSAHYDFSQTSVGAYQSISVNENVTFTVNLTNGGYNNAWGEDELKVCLADFTFNGNDPKVFAFNNIQVSKDWDNGNYYPAWRQTPASDDNNLAPVGIKNMTEQTNIFSVLNLRAGEIVKVKTADHSYAFGEGKAVKDRFIVEHSPNAYNNTPWANPNADMPISITTQEFVMTADGNLDLKVAGFVKILEIDIVSNYVNFDKSTVKAGNTINVTLPNRVVSTSGVNPNQTDKVGTDASNWTKANTNGWTANGAQNLFKNQYNGNSNHTSIDVVESWCTELNSQGHSLYQQISNLPNGQYQIELYVSSQNTHGDNSGFQTGDNDANQISYAYAKVGDNEQRAFFPVVKGDQLYNLNTCVLNIEVTNGNLEIGMGVDKANKVNWNTIQIKSLTLAVNDGIKYAMEEPVVLYYGDLTPGTVNTTKNSSGNWNISISNVQGKEYPEGKWWGGSVIVMLDQTMHTVTIPYDVNKDGYADFAAWNFWQNPLYVGRAAQEKYESFMSHDVAEGSFSLVYENTNNREPLYEYNGKMNGQNAYYHPETAGLIISTNGNQQYGILNENAEPEPDGNRYLGLQNGGSLTIPGLKAGDEVWVYFDHFGSANGTSSSSSSLGMKVTNATDALGKVIEDEVIVAGGSTWGPSFFNSNKEAKIYVGAMHFYAKADGDMTFIPAFSGNYNIMKIAYIRLVRHNSQNIISKTNSILWYNDGGPNGGYELLTTQDANGTYQNTYGSWGLHECGRGQKNQRFEVREASGNLSAYDINTKIDNTNYNLSQDGIGAYAANDGTNGKKFKYTTKKEPTFGSFLLRAMDYDHNGKYCFDYADRVIAVGYRQTMNYPYTWDFTDILNSETGNSQAEYDLSAAKFRPVGETQPVGGIYADTDTYNGNTIYMNDTTSVWVKYDNVISLQNARTTNENNRTLSSGTQLFASDTYIEEAAGLGWATINMDPGFNGSIQILDGGVKIQTYNGWETRLFVPAANKDGRIYLRGQKLNDGKGFVAKAYKNADMGPNTFKKTPDTRVAFTPVLPEKEVETVFYYEGNFSTYIEGQQEITETKNYDDVLTVVAGAGMEERLGSDRSVTNGTILYDEDGYNSRITSRTEHAYEYDDDGNPINEYDVTIIESDDNVYLNDEDTHDIDKALFDRNVSFCNSIGDKNITDFVYTNFIDTKDTGETNGRYLKLTLPESDYGFNVTVVARSQSSRQINIFAGDSWGSESSALATMVVQSNLAAKTTVAPAGTTSLLIGSDNSGVEIYAIYVEENKTVNASDPEDWAGYVDVAASDGGVTLYLNDIIIEKIGYSIDQKPLNIIGWASESRNYYIDHSLDSYFNGKTVDAYMVTSANQEQITWSGGTQQNVITSVSLTKIDKPMEFSAADGDPSAAKKTGCIIYCSDWDPDTDTGISLFVPDIHDYLLDSKIDQNFIGNTSTYMYNNYGNADQDKIIDVETAGNMMVAKLYQGTVPKSTVNDTYTNYVMAYKYTDGDGISHPTANEEPVERIVRSNNASLKANSAYIQFLTANVKPTWWTGDNTIAIVFDNEEGNADSIETIDINGADSANDVYYNLSGQRISKPTVPGVYVKNGKKVYVK